MKAGKENQQTISKLTIVDSLDLLLEVAKYGVLKGVKKLLEAGVHPNSQDEYGDTALMRAAGNGYIAIVELLLEKRSNSNIQNKGGGTALMFAASAGYVGIVQKLLQDKRTDLSKQ